MIMEGEGVLIAFVSAVVVAYVINRLVSRQPSEHRPEQSGQQSSDSDDATTPTVPRRLTPRLPRRRQGSDGHDATTSRARRAARGAAAPVDADLLRTLEELAAHPQNRAAAADLLRQRTGMSARHARRFINAL